MSVRLTPLYEQLHIGHTALSRAFISLTYFANVVKRLTRKTAQEIRSGG